MAVDDGNCKYCIEQKERIFLLEQLTEVKSGYRANLRTMQVLLARELTILSMIIELVNTQLTDVNSGSTN